MHQRVEFREDCPCCHASQIRPLESYERTFLTECLGCGFVFAGKLPTNDELAAHYAHKYENKYSPDAWVSPTTRKRLGELVRTFEPYRTHGRLLDVGCGQGLLLEAAQEANWGAFGSEYSEDAIGFGEERGFEMHQGELTAETYPQGYFDVIVLTEVIEHMREPKAELELVLQILRPGGLLYLTTPNFDSMSRRVLKDRWNVIEYPAHLGYFTATTLSKMLERMGARTKAIETTGFSPTRFKKSLLGQEHPEIEATDADEVVRNAMESGSVMPKIKTGINRGLTRARLGDVLKGYFVKTAR